MYFACCTVQRSRTNPARAQVWLCSLGESTCWQNPGVSLAFLSCILDKVLAGWQTGCIVSSPSPTVQSFPFGSVCFLHPGSILNFLCKRADLSPQRQGPFPRALMYSQIRAGSGSVRLVWTPWCRGEEEVSRRLGWGGEDQTWEIIWNRPFRTSPSTAQCSWVFLAVLYSPRHKLLAVGVRDSCRLL